MRYVTGQKARKVLAVMAILLATACGKVTEQMAPEDLATFDVNIYAFNKLVCDPMGDDPGGDPNYGKGIKTTLYYLRDDQPRYTRVQDYINNGMRASEHIFFSQINVPTRMFNTGFPKETGDLVKRDDGTDLYEYFAMRYSTVLKLGPNDEEGTYELALLSDDGAVWRLKNEAGDYETVVDNDGTHPTRMGCSPYRLDMTEGTERLMQLDYYQGPRFHISVIPMWRKVVPGQVDEVHCGRQGNNFFFNEADSSARAPYNELLARGWKPLNVTNYQLPISVIFNPCVDGVAPVISNFTVEDQADGVVLARWTTDIPATSQLRSVNMSNGVEDLTVSDNVLRTEHEIYVSALKPGTQYLFQGVSISDSYGKAISNPVTLLLQ